MWSVAFAAALVLQVLAEPVEVDVKAAGLNGSNLASDPSDGANDLVLPDGAKNLVLPDGAQNFVMPHGAKDFVLGSGTEGWDDPYFTSTDIPDEEDKFSCESDMFHWSEPHREWCCRHKERGCPGIPFDCTAGFNHWKTGWSNEKKEWCCQHDGIGCYDCDFEYDIWEYAWTQKKRDFCCLQEERGCFVCNHPNPNWMKEWSKEKQEWCCKTASTACPDDATTSSTSTTSPAAATAPPAAPLSVSPVPPLLNGHPTAAPVTAAPVTAAPGSTLPALIISPVPADATLSADATLWETLVHDWKKDTGKGKLQNSVFVISVGLLMAGVTLLLKRLGIVGPASRGNRSGTRSERGPLLDMGPELPV